jgi:hypothetical protein
VPSSDTGNTKKLKPNKGEMGMSVEQIIKEKVKSVGSTVYITPEIA